MKIRLLLSLFVLLISTKCLLAQQNPQESELKNQLEVLKKNLVKIDTAIVRGVDKGRFSAASSDTLYKLQDYIMDLNDRLYWMTNKDSLLNNLDGDAPKEGENNIDGNSMEEEKEIPMPQMDSLPKMDWGNLMPKPKVKKFAYFFQVQNGMSILLDHSSPTTGVTLPEWKSKAVSNPGATLVYALRLGKADLSKIKFEFNIKKKLTNSKFITASPWQLRLGLGLQRYEIHQTTNLEINQNTQKEVTFIDNKKEYNKNILGIYYIHIPLTVWRKIANKTFIEAGGFADIIRTTKQTLTYKDNGISNTLIRKGDFGTNAFAYGATVAVGGSAFAIYANYHLSPLFTKNTAFDYNLMSVGLRIGY
jgi:hypothetical protein